MGSRHFHHLMQSSSYFTAGCSTAHNTLQQLVDGDRCGQCIECNIDYVKPTFLG